MSKMRKCAECNWEPTDLHHYFGRLLCPGCLTLEAIVVGNHSEAENAIVHLVQEIAGGRWDGLPRWLLEICDHNDVREIHIEELPVWLWIARWQAPPEPNEHPLLEALQRFKVRHTERHRKIARKIAEERRRRQ